MTRSSIKKRRYIKGQKNEDEAVPVVFTEKALLVAAASGATSVCTPYGLRVSGLTPYSIVYTKRVPLGTLVPNWHLVYRLGRVHRAIMKLDTACTFQQALEEMHDNIGRVGTGDWDYNSLRIQLHDGSLMWFDHAQVEIEKVMKKISRKTTLA